MRVPVSWLVEYVDLPTDLDLTDLTHRLTMLGLKLERLDSVGRTVTGPLVVGRVLAFETETHANGKTIRWCQVDVGPEHNDPDGGRGIVCGAHDFEAGDLVVVSLPGTVLPGGFEITARKTYGHLSDGMICSARELELGDDHAGIIVLDPDVAAGPGADARPVLHLVDDVIEFEIAPDRGYALSVRGVARESALATGADWHDPADLPTPPVQGEAYPVVIDDPVGCPVFVTRVVTGVDVTRRTPQWMARRLQLAGMRPLSLAIDITNYVMLELGQPIHGYDRARLQGPIRVRRAAAGEKLTTLDGVPRTLDVDDLLITDDSGPIGLAGVMGGQTTELSASTTEVVIEAAHFEPATVSRTARRHRLPSEASKRFERGVDPALPRFAGQRVADLLAELGGGTVLDDVTMVGEPPLLPTLDVAASLSRDLVGLPITDDDAADSLRAVGCVVEQGGGRLQVTPPTWRPDLVDPYDLVEEVARIAGYDNLPSPVPAAAAGAGLTHPQLLRRRISRGLAGIGLVEVKTYPFVGSEVWDALGFEAADVRRRAIRIANPLSDEEPFLTTSLLPGLLRTLARNVSRGVDDVALFEAAPVFLPEAEPTAAPILEVSRRPTDAELSGLLGAVPPQPLHLASVHTGLRERAGWWVWRGHRLDRCRGGHARGGPPRRRRARPRQRWAGAVASGPLRRAVHSRGGHRARRRAASEGLRGDGCATAQRRRRDRPRRPPRRCAGPGAGAAVSTYPVAKEDVALVVDASVAAGDLAASLRAGAGELLESVRLFDVYVGEQVPDGGPSRSRCASAPRTEPSPTPRSRRPATRPWPRPPFESGPSSAHNLAPRRTPFLRLVRPSSGYSPITF